MMAPYAIAHMKLGLKLADTGYRFPDGGPRVRVFLSNSLQPPTDVQPQFELMAPMLAHEARAANAVKEHLATTVIIGNPPYSGHSVNNNVPDIVDAVHDYKRGYPDLQKPGQAKWLQNDYVKFIRFAERRVLQARTGVLGYITDHSYLDNPTFKGMRRHLLDSFGDLWVVDLHGNSKKKEKAEDGSKDENVFDITQGAAVGVFARLPGAGHGVRSADLLGTRAIKYERLAGMSLHREATLALAPNAPFWLFKPQEQAWRSEYEAGWSLPTIFSPNGDPAPGIVTTHDEFAISWDSREARRKVESLLATATETEARELFQLCTQDQWNYDRAKAGLADGSWKRRVQKVLYRPFDVRVTVWDSNVAVHRRERVSNLLLSGDNVAMTVGKAGQVIDGESWNIICATRFPTDFNYFRRGGNCPFPLWRLNAQGDRIDLLDDDLVSTLPTRAPNLDLRFIAAVRSALAISDSEWHPEKKSARLNAEKLFHYIYGVLHSPTYRDRYSEFLKIAFPRVPVPASLSMLDGLSRIGQELFQWHLLEHPSAVAIAADSRPPSMDLPVFVGNDRELSRVGESGRSLSDVEEGARGGHVGKVLINASSGFAGVSLRVWQHSIGGYQVLHKWLDDRRKAGRSLSDDDIAHWRRIYAALQATQKLMLQVDEVIERHGGWPTGPGEGGAFSLDHPPPSAEVLAAQAAARPRGRRRAVQPGQQSLLGGNDDPEPAPARPTPATQVVRTNGEDLDDGETMCAMRAALAQVADSLPRDDLIRAAARAMGYARTSARLADELDDAIRRAVRRGVAINERGALTLATRSIEDYERDALKAQVLAVVRAQRAWVPREDVPRLLARWLGFGRTGGRIVEATESVLRSLVRAGELQAQDGAVRPA